MNHKLPWQPPQLVISLLGSQGGLLVVLSIPLGIWLGCCMYHTDFGDLRAAILRGIVVTLVTSGIGYVSFSLCTYFSKRQWRFNLETLHITVHEILNQLIHGDYEGVIQRCATSRLTSRDLLAVVEDYGQKLVSPPPDVLNEMKPMRIVGVRIPTWSVQVPMWTENEYRSDLTLELTIAVVGGIPSVRLDDFHVL